VDCFVAPSYVPIIGYLLARAKQRAFPVIELVGGLVQCKKNKLPSSLYTPSAQALAVLKPSFCIMPS
jgi:hypothetical protein